MRKTALFTLMLAGLIGLSSCSSQEPTLADEISQENMERIETAPSAPAKSEVQSEPIDENQSYKPRKKKVVSKKASPKKVVASKKKKKRKVLSRW